MILTVESVNYEIENWNEFRDKLLWAIGFQIESEIRTKIKDFKLIDTSDFWQSIGAEVVNGELIVYSTAPYAVYLEYGTYQYWDQYGLGSFPATPHPKKKDMKPEERKNYPAGLQPFAVFRRVMWNENRMGEIIQKAARVASK